MADKPFIGVFVSEEIDNSLRLVALLQGISKSALIRDIIQDKAEDNGWTEESLVERYADITYLNWSLKYRDTQTFHEYLSIIKIKLEVESNLPINIQAKIMKKCKDLNQNQSKIK